VTESVPISTASSAPEARRFRTVAIAAGILALLIVSAQLALVLTLVPSVATLFSDMGGEVPGATQLLFDLSGAGVLPFVVVLVDLVVFAAMYALARRYWIGLLFAPAAVYFAMSVALLPLLFLPMQSVITVVE